MSFALLHPLSHSPSSVRMFYHGARFLIGFIFLGLLNYEEKYSFKDGVFNTFMSMLPYSHFIFRGLKTDTACMIPVERQCWENTYLYKCVRFLFIFLA